MITEPRHTLLEASGCARRSREAALDLTIQAGSITSSAQPGSRTYRLPGSAIVSLTCGALH